MMKAILTLVGGLVGLVIAYAVRPSVWGIRPDLADILSDPSLQVDFLIYGSAGLAIGFGLGFVIDALLDRTKK